MNSRAARLPTAVVGLLNVAIPLGLLVWYWRGSNPWKEVIPFWILVGGLHLAASASFQGAAASRTSVRWKWIVTVLLLLICLLQWSLYLYVCLYPQGMAFLVFLWGPLVEMVVAGLIALGARIANGVIGKLSSRSE